MSSSPFPPVAAAGETVFLSIGSNQGDARANINEALGIISLADGVDINAVSSLYLTEPEGMKSEQWFLNCAVEITTLLPPLELLDVLEEVERRLGRVGKGENAPRTMDVDILMFGGRVVSHPRLCLPHPRMARRKFVLEPLLEIAPDAVHPALGVTIRELNEKADGAAAIRQNAYPRW